MLTKEDNEVLCRVGPGTTMGALLRQYWIPALMSSELATPDCPPMRLRLLGENLIAFRVTSGDVGVVQNACPHRGASLFFGRNEEDGLRCVYHGWKFDTAGACVDMPSEPAESNFKSKVRAGSYPCMERNGVIWTYMGPRETPPPLPDLEANLHADGRQGKVLRECNFMNGMEGDIDTVHAGFLHYGSVPLDAEGDWVRSDQKYKLGDRTPRYKVIDTEFGATYGAYRAAERDSTYWRIAHFLFPFYTMTPSGKLGAGVSVGASVPIDDENTMRFGMSSRAVDSDARDQAARAQMNIGRRAASDEPNTIFLPDTSDWIGKFRLAGNASNDYNLDREVQKHAKTKDGYTGLAGTLMQDQAITESMGKFYDRSQEHLGTSDAMIIRARRLLVNAAKALQAHGTVPPGVDQPEVYRHRSGWVVLPNEVDWLEGTASLRESFRRQAEPVAATVSRS